MELHAYDLDDRLYARMVDGRLIYFHTMFVEPVIHRVNASQQGPPVKGGGDAFVPFEWIERELTAATTAAPGGIAVTGWLSLDVAVPVGDAPIAVGRFAEGTDEIIPATHHAVDGIQDLIRLADKVGLSYLIQLGVGAIVVTDRIWPGTTRPLMVAAVGVKGSAIDRLCSLIRCAAENIAWMWMTAEESLRRPGTVLWPDERYAELASAFGEEAVVELEQRLREAGLEPPPSRFSPLNDWSISELLQWLDALPGVPLAKELFCCWYPRWWQAGFITDSPFDFIRELPLAADPTLPLVKVLELERRGLWQDGHLVLSEVDRAAFAEPARTGNKCSGGERAAALARRFRDDGLHALIPGLRPLSMLAAAEAAELPRLPFSRPDFNRRVIAQQLDQTTDQSSRRLAVIFEQMAWLRDKIGSVGSIMHPMSGPGLFARALRATGATRYVGIDCAAATIDQARAWSDLPDGFEFQLGDITQPEAYPDGQFDLVINGYESLNCFPPAEGLGLVPLWAQHVRPGGHLVIEARFRSSDTSTYIGRSFSHEAAGSGVDLGDHYLLDELGVLADGSAVGHRLFVVPCDRPDRTTIYNTLVWLYDFEEVAAVLSELGFDSELYSNPAEDCVDTKESLGAQLLIARRSGSVAGAM